MKSAKLPEPPRELLDKNYAAKGRRRPGEAEQQVLIDIAPPSAPVPTYEEDLEALRPPRRTYNVMRQVGDEIEPWGFPWEDEIIALQMAEIFEKRSRGRAWFHVW